MHTRMHAHAHAHTHAALHLKLQTGCEKSINSSASWPLLFLKWEQKVISPRAETDTQRARRHETTPIFTAGLSRMRLQLSKLLPLFPSTSVRDSSCQLLWASLLHNYSQRLCSVCFIFSFNFHQNCTLKCAFSDSDHISAAYIWMQSMCVCGWAVRERERKWGRKTACMLTYALHKFTRGDDYESAGGRWPRRVTQSI